MEYTLAFDYHTHTDFSDGKNTIRENVLAARAKGLREIAITDHGPGQVEHGIMMSAIPEVRKIITDLNKEFDDIKVYLGIEANIKHTNNALDIPKEYFSQFDFVAAGYHNSVLDAYSHENWNDWHRGIRSPKRLVENTDMTLKAIYENDLKILTHPGGGYHVDIREIAKACAKTDTWMEINARNMNITVKQIRECEDIDVKFVLASDAHKAEEVGDVRLAVLRALEAEMDLDKIVNCSFE